MSSSTEPAQRGAFWWLVLATSLALNVLGTASIGQDLVTWSTFVREVVPLYQQVRDATLGKLLIVLGDYIRSYWPWFAIPKWMADVLVIVGSISIGYRLTITKTYSSIVSSVDPDFEDPGGTPAGRRFFLFMAQILIFTAAVQATIYLLPEIFEYYFGESWRLFPTTALTIASLIVLIYMIVLDMVRGRSSILRELPIGMLSGVVRLFVQLIVFLLPFVASMAVLFFILFVDWQLQQAGILR